MSILKKPVLGSFHAVRKRLPQLQKNPGGAADRKKRAYLSVVAAAALCYNSAEKTDCEERGIMSGKKVVAAGHICLDITPLFPPQRCGRPEELLIPGKLLRMDGVDVHTGGSVANTGLAMKILGADVRLMGKIGDDAFGRMILDILAQYGCDGKRDMIVASDAVTSYSVVLAVPGSDRIFLHAPGANDTFAADDPDMAAVADADLFHFGYPPLMRTMYQNGGEELVRLFQTVKAYGLATSLDMAAVDPASEAGSVDWRGVLTRLIPCVDFFLPSAEELCFMLDRPRWEEWMRRVPGGDVTETLDAERDIRPLADLLMDMGARVIVIKCGAPGMYYRTAGADALAEIGYKVRLDTKSWAKREGFRPGFKPERVCSATGAGDVSIAAFLTAMLQGRGVEDCVRFAAGEGASCVEAYDALSGLRSFAELEKKFAAEWAE